MQDDELEECEQDINVYSDSEELLNNDEISVEEQCFMIGYMST